MPDGGLFDLTGKVVVVTGGNRGIGLAMARAVAGAGAAVAIWGRDEQRNATAAEEMRGLGGSAVAVRCDVGDEDEVERAAAETVDALGGIDACFANAGVTPTAAPLAEFPTEEWRRVLAVDLDGVFFTFRAAARQMIDQERGGSLVAISSVAALDGQPRRHPYATAKAGILALVRSCAVELARHGIRANAVLPGWVQTDALDSIVVDDKIRDAALRRIPQRRFGDPAHFGGVAVYLASDASAYHTGDTLVVDGGYSVF